MGEDVQNELFAAPRDLSVALRVADVAVAAPVRQLLTYALPDAAQIAPGARVRAPLGPRTVEGFVVRIRDGRDETRGLKYLVETDDVRPLFTSVTLELGLWLADRYGAHPGECFQTVVPAPVRAGGLAATVRRARLTASAEACDALIADASKKPSLAAQARVIVALRAGPPPTVAELSASAIVGDSPIKTLAKRGVIEIFEEAAPDDELDAVRPPRATAPDPTADQAVAADKLVAALESGRFGAFLLYGVTGSGKTEVYLRLCEAALAAGRGVIMLVPEIALTPQTVGSFRARLGDVAVLHSNQSDGARRRRWEDLRSGRVRVALGPRSALFAPIENVGAIIVDEEHETTFKQQNAPRYHARDAALRRGAAENAVVVLGSATPSLEAERLADTGVIERLTLSTRAFGGASMPDVRIVDMRHEKPTGPGGLFSQALLFQSRRALARGEQVLLFLNRVGFSTQVLCRNCGEKGRCTACDVNLTYHRDASHLLCHYCGQKFPVYARCPACQHPDIRYSGAGTERVLEAATVLFPGKRVARMDGETLQARGAPERLFTQLKNREIDVVVGTQVIAKGLDLPGITLIGVINADTALLLPDFRAAERTFQLLCQVAGRAGRGDKAGLVLIQTYEPQHYAITAAARHDHPGFARAEAAYRREAGYPPFGKMLRIIAQGAEDSRVEDAIAIVAAELAAARPLIGGGAQVLGPAPCPMHRMQGVYRRHLILKADDDAAIDAAMRIVSESRDGDVRLILDRDPVAML